MTWLSVGLLAVLLAAPSAHGRDREAGNDHRRLVVVHSSDTPPLSFVGITGVPKGLVYDFWEAWSRKTGVRVSYVQTDWPTSLAMLRDGRADVHGGLYFNEARNAVFDFTTPLFNLKASLFMRAALGVTSIADLGDRYVAVLDRGYSEYWLAKHHPELKQKAYKTSSDMVQAAVRGEVDCLLTEYTTLVYQLGAIGKIKEFVPLADMYEEELRAAVVKGRGDMLALLEEGIQAMGDDGRRKVFERWIIAENTLPEWLFPAAGVGVVALCIGVAAMFFSGRRLG